MAVAERQTVMAPEGDLTTDGERDACGDIEPEPEFGHDEVYHRVLDTEIGNGDTHYADSEVGEQDDRQSIGSERN